MESGIVLMLRLMRGSSERFVFKDFHITCYFVHIYFGGVSCLYCLYQKIFHFQLPSHFFSFCYVDGNNIPENLWVFLIIKLICYKRTYFETLKFITLHWVWVNLVIPCTVVLNIGLYHFPSLVSHVTPWKKWLLRNLVVIFSIFSLP